MIDSTLLLNADAQPINLLPLSSMSWEEAIKSQYLGDSEVLHYHDDWTVHSPSVTMRVPAVILLKEQIKVKRDMRLINSGPSASLLFLRDGFRCGYCSKVFPRNQLTCDHVLPRKYGGKTTWVNTTTSCSPCNGKRGHDMRIQPKTQPYRPTYDHLIKMLKKFPLIIPHESWNYFLGWSPELVKIVDPRSGEPCDNEHLQMP